MITNVDLRLTETEIEVVQFKLALLKDTLTLAGDRDAVIAAMTALSRLRAVVRGRGDNTHDGSVLQIDIDKYMRCIGLEQ